ncbi:hypothetical protein [Kineothrix sedimenti]|uniref:Uncharacterized protein n=1 Tax=Kineothrix sedimenti TaxID=3123317 RepID=A0ABZ3EUW4_9FIRM
MAIMQQYRGNEDDWDVAKMKPGQFAVSLDRKYVRMCFAPGVAEKMALYDAFEEDMLQIQQILATCEDIQTAVEAFEALAQQHANDAAASATASANSATESSDSATLSESWAVGGKGIRPGEDTNNAKYWAGVAQAVADVQIATNDTPGIVKGNEGEINIDIGGQMSIPSDFTPQTTLEAVTGTEDKKTFFGKVAKVITDFMAHAANTSIHFGLTNNLLATVAGTALDATQGKILDDKITALGNVVTATVLTATGGTSVASGATASVTIPFTWPSGYSTALLASLRTTGANGLAVSAVLVSSINQNVTVTATNLTGSAVTLNPSVMLLFGK